MATVQGNLDFTIHFQSILQSLIQKFDIDYAEGDQLDIIGKWVGVSRNVNIPITGVYFSWDSDFTLGWDFGTWQDINQPTELSRLPDSAYRTLIRAKIAANQWDGTTESAYEIWDEIFPDFTILVQDNQDMSYELGIVGGIVDSLTLALITGGYIPLKPEGVRVTLYYVPIDSEPFFAWDTESDYVKGWDEGHWARIIG